jgi:hypothetical protein
MNILGAITGIFMLFVPVKSEVAVTKNIYNATVLAGKIIEKTEQGNWKASIHEEGYTGIKNLILEIGGLK